MIHLPRMLTVCGLLLAAPACGEPTAETPPAAQALSDDSLTILSDGIMTMSAAGQDVIYSGHSEFRWGALEIVVEGQLHVFWGVSLKRRSKGVDARSELQSITANGTVTVAWIDSNGHRQSLRVARLVIAPGRASDGAALVTAVPAEPMEPPSAGRLRWVSLARKWTLHKMNPIE